MDKEETEAANAVEATAEGGAAVENGVEMVVTEVLGGGGLFFAQRAAGNRAAWLFDELQLKTNTALSFAPHVGDAVAGKFTGDDCWYRAIITTSSRGFGGPLGVFYCDFGNSESIEQDRIKPLDPSLSMSALPPQAHLCQLSMIRVPALASELGPLAASFLQDALTRAPVMIARVDERERFPTAKPWEPLATAELKIWITPHYANSAVTSEEEMESVNEAIVSAGLARVEKRFASRLPHTPAIAALVEAQNQARMKRLNLFEYGDPDSDEDEAVPQGSNTWGRRR